MAVARWQATITDSSGNVVPNASVAVVSETTGALATIFSDRAGTVSISNPTTADSDGFVAFFAAGDAYKITATSGATTRQFRYVGIGTSQETDQELVTVIDTTVFSGATGIVVTGIGVLYREVIIEYERANVAVDGSDLLLTVSVDNGSTFLAGTNYLSTLDRRTATTAALSGSTGAANATISSNLGTGTGEFYQGKISLLNLTDTSTYKHIKIEGSVYDATPDFRSANMNLLVTTLSAITDLQIVPSASTFSGKITVKAEFL